MARSCVASSIAEFGIQELTHTVRGGVESHLRQYTDLLPSLGHREGAATVWSNAVSVDLMRRAEVESIPLYECNKVKSNLFLKYNGSQKMTSPCDLGVIERTKLEHDCAMQFQRCLRSY
jgi:hypothetical protein